MSTPRDVKSVSAQLSRTQKNILIKKLSASARINSRSVYFIPPHIFLHKQPTIINCLFYSPRKLRRLLMILGNKLQSEFLLPAVVLAAKMFIIKWYHYTMFPRELVSAGFSVMGIKFYWDTRTRTIKRSLPVLTLSES